MMLNHLNLAVTDVGAAKAFLETFHIGFIQPTEEAVNAINERMVQDGDDVRPPKRFHGLWTFYANAPGGFSVEVMC